MKWLKKLLQKIRNKSEQVKAVEEFSRQGLSATEVLKRTKDAVILARLSGLSLEESVRSLTAALNSYKELSSKDVINKLEVVDTNFEVSSKELAQAIQRTGSAAKDAQVSFDDLLNLVAAAYKSTARDGEIIGNSLKAIITRLHRDETMALVRSFGIEPRTNSYEYLKGIAKRYNELSPEHQELIARTIAGARDTAVFKALMKNV